MRRLRVWLPLAAVFAVAAVLCGVAYPAKDRPANDFAFAIVGDRTGGAQLGVYERIWHEIDQHRPNFAITAGDTIEGGNDATAESEWRQLRPIWSKHSYPVYFTPGNHDIWSDASRRIYERETGRPAHYSFNYQNAHFTVLDNSRSLQLSGPEMRFL